MIQVHLLKMDLRDLAAEGESDGLCTQGTEFVSRYDLFTILPAFLCRIDVSRFMTLYRSNMCLTPERMNVCSYHVAVGHSTEGLSEYRVSTF
jgi:hypothetical protein